MLAVEPLPAMSRLPPAPPRPPAPPTTGDLPPSPGPQPSRPVWVEHDRTPFLVFLREVVQVLRLVTWPSLALVARISAFIAVTVAVLCGFLVLVDAAASTAVRQLLR